MGTIEPEDFRGQLTALESITRAEIDTAVATAKRYPRSFTKFLAEAKTMVASDPDLAGQCSYFLPARTGNKNDPPITGPSVRLAEICVIAWGNIRVVSRLIDDDGRFITAQAIARDMEKNVEYGVEVRRGVTRKNGARYSDDMVKTTGEAAKAIASRNATFKVIPRAFVNIIEQEAQRVARGDERSLGERTAAALAWFGRKGISEERVFAALGIAGPADMSVDLLLQLNGLKTAVKDGMATIEEVFAPAPDPARTPIEVPGESRTEAVTRKIQQAAGEDKADYRSEGGEAN